MAAQYVPVFSHDEHHQAAGINEVEMQRKNQRLSATQLSSLHIDDDERNLTSSQTVDGTSTPPKESLVNILHDHWLWELASLFLSTAALAAVVVLLIYWDGKPLFQWSSSISLNTFVSTLGTAHKSGLALFIGACLGQQKWNWFHQHTDRLEVLETFDEASRGPWGSTKLIYQLLPRWNLSHLACLVLLISLTFDAFLQATISLHGSMDRSTDIYSIPTIGRSTNAAVGSLLIIAGSPEAVYPEGNSSGPDYDGFTTYPSLGLVSAIFNGLDDSSAAQQDRVDSSCKTGNCTWPVFASAAICGTCNDVSKYISKDRVYGYPSSQPQPPNVVANESYTSFDLPYCSIKNADGGYLPDSSADPSPVPNSILTVNVTTDYLESLTFSDANTTFLIFIMMKADPNYINGSAAWEESTPSATECGLSMCVNAYNSTIQSGSLIEEKVASWQNRESDSWLLTDGYGEKYEWWDETYPSFSDCYNLFRSDLQLSIPPTDSARGLGIDTGERFNITQGTIASIQDWIVTWGFGVVDSLCDFGTPALIAYPTNAESAHPLAEVLYNSANLNGTFAGLSSSLTNYIRDSSTTKVQGDTQQYVIKFKVRWAFLTVPALHILGGITYVLAIVWQTKNSGLPVWKTRVIPSLAFGLNAAAQDQLRSGLGDLDLASHSIRRKMMITFDTTGDRPQLRLSESLGHDEESVKKHLNWIRRKVN